ncbi:hypothetical protein ACJX0J_020255, partial [Zea mays]
LHLVCFILYNSIDLYATTFHHRSTKILKVPDTIAHQHFLYLISECCFGYKSTAFIHLGFTGSSSHSPFLSFFLFPFPFPFSLSLSLSFLLGLYSSTDNGGGGGGGRKHCVSLHYILPHGFIFLKNRF